MHEGVDVEISKNQKDELTITGNSLENVSQSAADIQQICRVRNKDIRKVREGQSKMYRATLMLLSCSFWTGCTYRKGRTSKLQLRVSCQKRQAVDKSFFKAMISDQG